MNELQTVSDHVQSHQRGRWEWFTRTDPPPYEITGKYLFFSHDRDLLKQIAIEELEKYGYHRAKIPLPGMAIGGEYILCLYYLDDSNKHHLAVKYQKVEGVRFRYWKSEEATSKGEYSEQFLHALSHDFGDKTMDTSKVMKFLREQGVGSDIVTIIVVLLVNLMDPPNPDWSIDLQQPTAFRYKAIDGRDVVVEMEPAFSSESSLPEYLMKMNVRFIR